eukprot:UN04457
MIGAQTMNEFKTAWSMTTKQYDGVCKECYSKCGDTDTPFYHCPTCEEHFDICKNCASRFEDVDSVFHGRAQELRLKAIRLHPEDCEKRMEYFGKWAERQLMQLFGYVEKSKIESIIIEHETDFSRDPKM